MDNMMDIGLSKMVKIFLTGLIMLLLKVNFLSAVVFHGESLEEIKNIKGTEINCEIVKGKIG
ncbi:MAG: hypothetical protein Q7I94_05640, partial [Candidatus Contubernalis sp.]|nr:hypothetical protein [Candidatus Contubernalis sp.]